MKSVLCFFLIALLAGCAISPKAMNGVPLIHWEPQSEKNSSIWSGNECHLSDDVKLIGKLHHPDGEPLTDGPLDPSLADAILLSKISYCKLSGKSQEFTWDNSIWFGRIRATEVFAKLGFRAAYVHPNYNWFFRDPNYYVLGIPGSNRVTIVIPGTEGGSNPLDNWQNIKATAFWDKPGTQRKARVQRAYIPRGHTGFRSSASAALRHGNLFEHANSKTELLNYCGSFEPEKRIKTDSDFGTFHIADFICLNNIMSPDSDGSINVVLVGHSRGAGIAQMLAPAIDGYYWPEGAEKKLEERHRNESKKNTL